MGDASEHPALHAFLLQMMPVYCPGRPWVYVTPCWPAPGWLGKTFAPVGVKIWSVPPNWVVVYFGGDQTVLVPDGVSFGQQQQQFIWRPFRTSDGVFPGCGVWEPETSRSGVLGRNACVGRLTPPGVGPRVSVLADSPRKGSEGAGDAE